MTESTPNFEKGIEYWENVDASVDGVLGGFGEGHLPRVEELSSRLFLLSLLPHLQSFASPLSAPAHQAYTTYRQQKTPYKRFVGLDVGAGVGRVTKNSLLPLLDDVVTTEPVGHFITTARDEALAGDWTFLEDRSENAVSTTDRQSPSKSTLPPRKSQDDSSEEEEEQEPVYDKLGNIIPRSSSTSSTTAAVSQGKRVWFVQAPLNDLNPAQPTRGVGAKSLGVVGGRGGDETFGERRTTDLVYDVIWCQWCLGHLSNEALVAFLRQCHRNIHQPCTFTLPDGTSLSNPGGVIVVKENVCSDLAPNEASQGQPRAVSVLDEEDSSLTRSNKMWEEIFEQAGLKIVKEQVQEGLPAGLFLVKAWALR